MSARLPAHLEVAALIRAVDSNGGFATVISKGDRDAGTLLLICCEKGENARAFERMPQADGNRAWTLSKAQDADDPAEFWSYIERRRKQDSDLWVVELDIADAERFIL